MWIRIATVDDIPLIVEMCREMTSEGLLEGDEFEESWVEMNVKAALERPGYLTIVYDDGGLKGFCSGFVQTAIHNSRIKAAEHHMVYMRKDYRKTWPKKAVKAVEAMLKVFVEWAREMGAKRVYFAPSYMMTNPDSWDRMAQRLGFAKTGHAFRRTF